MVEKEVHQIHKTEFIDKQLPTISYQKVNKKSTSESEGVHIVVSDASSKEALKTLKEILKVK